MPFTKDDATLAFEEIDKTNSGTITKMPQLQDYCNTNHINVSKMYDALDLSQKSHVKKEEFVQAAADGKLEFMANGRLTLHRRNLKTAGASSSAPSNFDILRETSLKSPTEADMKDAAFLYVQLQMDYTTNNPDVKDRATLEAVLGDMGATSGWAGIPGMRHKYFIYHSETDVCSGCYVFYTKHARETYMKSELFASHEKLPHVSKVTALPLDVMPGTELAIEKTAWKNSPPTRGDVTAAKMLIVDITMKYDTGVEGLPTKSEDLYGFMAAPPNGMGYPGMFGGLEGLRGKYFCYNADIHHCYGFYTFVDQAGLDKYMASELFCKQGDPPHISDLSYTVHDVLPGTERTMDLGEWRRGK